MNGAHCVVYCLAAVRRQEILNILSLQCNNTNKLLLLFRTKIMWSAERVSLITNHNTRNSQWTRSFELIHTCDHHDQTSGSQWGVVDGGNPDYSSPSMRAWVLRVFVERKGKDVLGSVFVSVSSSKHNKIIRALVGSCFDSFLCCEKRVFYSFIAQNNLPASIGIF